MADIYDEEKRSDIMRKIKSKKNKSTELRLMELFRESGITGWRRNYPVKGHPDFVFLDKRVAIFVDGCFWHGHDCRNTKPASNQKFWKEKLQRSMEHDKEVTSHFVNRGWTVLRIWECELKKHNSSNVVNRIIELVK